MKKNPKIISIWIEISDCENPMQDTIRVSQSQSLESHIRARSKWQFSIYLSTYPSAWNGGVAAVVVALIFSLSYAAPCTTKSIRIKISRVCLFYMESTSERDRMKTHTHTHNQKIIKINWYHVTIYNTILNWRQNIRKCRRDGVEEIYFSLQLNQMIWCGRIFWSNLNDI